MNNGFVFADTIWQEVGNYKDIRRISEFGYYRLKLGWGFF